MPFDEDGVHHGFLRLPYSRDDSAWGSVMIPITVARNGDGPTALLTGGNHGDEYEGPVALQALTPRARPSAIRGRVIVVPFMNTPAFRAGTRTSPLDGGNLNRTFPGRPDGTPTEKIADYFYRDAGADGRLRARLPLRRQDAGLPAVRRRAPAGGQRRRRRPASPPCAAFNAPYSMVLLEIDSVGMFDTAVEALGKLFVSTELGGGGTATARSIAIARKGARNFLIHAGILDGEPEVGPSVDLDMPGADCFLFSEHEGLVEPVVDLGAEVTRGALLARIWPGGAHRRRAGRVPRPPWRPADRPALPETCQAGRLPRGRGEVTSRADLTGREPLA